MQTPSPCPYCHASPVVERPGKQWFRRLRTRSCWSIGCANLRCSIIIFATGDTQEDALATWERKVQAAQHPEHAKTEEVGQ